MFLVKNIILSIVHVLNKDEYLETTFIQQKYWTSQLAGLLKLLWYLFCVEDKCECQNELIFSQPSNIRFQIRFRQLSNLRFKVSWMYLRVYSLLVSRQLLVMAKKFCSRIADYMHAPFDLEWFYKHVCIASTKCCTPYCTIRPFDQQKHDLKKIRGNNLIVTQLNDSFTVFTGFSFDFINIKIL